jgi:DNA-binding NarL/FixJ family response regulator
MLRILIVDNAAVVWKGLTAILSHQSDMTVVGEAANGQEGIEAYRQHRPDVVLMDVSMPLMDGIEATHILLAEFPNAVVLLFSAGLPEEVLPQVTASGAKGIIDKAAPREELLAALRAV